jgi:transcriptional regulator with XRE-family HTH domain
VSLRQIIATAVSTRRAAAGLSRRELAERCGVSMDTVQRVEADDDDPRARAPSVGVLERLAGGLGVPVAALVGEPDAVPSIVHK